MQIDAVSEEKWGFPEQTPDRQASARLEYLDGQGVRRSEGNACMETGRAVASD